jgi:hypothetical protein
MLSWVWIGYLSIAQLFPVFGRQCYCKRRRVGGGILGTFSKVHVILVVAIASGSSVKEVGNLFLHGGGG